MTIVDNPGCSDFAEYIAESQWPYPRQYEGAGGSPFAFGQEYAAVFYSCLYFFFLSVAPSRPTHNQRYQYDRAVDGVYPECRDFC